MKYTIAINQKSAIELGIKNINQAAIFDLLIGAAAWASPVIVGNDVYYWVARQSIANELPILGLKPDTIYRHLKALSEIGLINHIKSGKKDLMSITEKGKTYYVGNKSEKIEQLGFKSEKQPNNSDLNPTYHITNNINHNTKDHSCEISENLFEKFWKKSAKNGDKKKAKKIFIGELENHPDKSAFTDMLIEDTKKRLSLNQLGFDNMHITTYLNNQRWEDEHAKSNGISKQGNGSPADAAAELRRRLGQSDDIFAELRENSSENESVVVTYDRAVRG